MKYKIGNVEVEAVQWNGYLKGIFDFISHRGFEAPSIKLAQGGTVVVNHTNLSGSLFVEIKDYLAISKKSIFALSEQDFNNMATKVKEPKFKVGDKVYNFAIDDEYHCFRLLKISSIPSAHSYLMEDDNGQDVYYESDLFTLEEAIEKLKEL